MDKKRPLHCNLKRAFYLDQKRPVPYISNYLRELTMNTDGFQLANVICILCHTVSWHSFGRKWQPWKGLFGWFAFLAVEGEKAIYFFSVFLGRRTAWMLGRTPPWAMVTPERSLFNSSSLRMASWRWRGMILVFLLSRAALPANSRISAVRYSRTAAK